VSIGHLDSELATHLLHKNRADFSLGPSTRLGRRPKSWSEARVQPQPIAHPSTSRTTKRCGIICAA